MTNFSYGPLCEPFMHYEFSEDFEFGCGDNDDEEFGRAWDAMVERGFVTVRFEGCIEGDVLEEAGAILSRVDVPPAEQYRGMDLNLALKDLSSRDEEAIFRTNADAHVAAMMFGGRVIK